MIMNPRRQISLAIVGTSLPRVCGLATFSRDLIREMAVLPGFAPPRVVAVNDDPNRYRYGPAVMGEIAQHVRRDYVAMADRLNHSGTDVVILHHEFGIYGGAAGDYVLDLAAALTVPLIVVLHTVLTTPSPDQRRVVRELAARSATVVTMAHNTVPVLLGTYAVEPAKVVVIPHGVPSLKTAPRADLRAKLGLGEGPLLSTFGFLSPGKGIEYAIRAMSLVLPRYPEAHYLVLGETHPVVKSAHGEAYRARLRGLADHLGIASHVIFVDRFLSPEEIVESLVASDVCLTPYLGAEQAVSGTLAYAVGYGRAVVSTPYRYATELLAENRGMLAPFRDGAALADRILYLLDHPEVKRTMEANALQLGSAMRWGEVAARYADLCQEALRAESLNGQPL